MHGARFGSRKGPPRHASKAAAASIAIVCDDPWTSRGLRTCLERELAGKRRVEEWRFNVLLATDSLRLPSILLVDTVTARPDAPELNRAWTLLARRSKVIVLLAPDDLAHVPQWMNAGVSGYVLKACEAAELLRAVESVRKGEVYFSPRILDLARESGVADTSPPASLTPQERRVLERISQSQTNKQIAAELHLSVRTVEHHRASLMKKLGAHGVAALVRSDLQRCLAALSQGRAHPAARSGANGPAVA